MRCDSPKCDQAQIFLCSTRGSWSPGQLWIPPVDAFEHISHLRRRDRHRAIRRRGPDELAAVQALGVERQTDPVMPQDFDEVAAPAAEDVEITGMRIALQALLNCKRQALHATAHVRLAS